MAMSPEVEALVAAWRAARRVLVFTGAGMSTESGLPDFRSATGLWRQRPESLATLETMRRQPNEFYYFYAWRIKKLWSVEPNAGHRALADLERAGRLTQVVTQNVDGLHQRAGTSNCVELHGTLRTVRCLRCRAEVDSREMLPAREWSEDEYRQGLFRAGDEIKCKRDGCAGTLRPNVVLFGEGLPQDQWRAAEESVRACRAGDLCVVVGSSLAVGPANTIPEMAAEAGATLAIVNAEATHLDGEAQILVREPAAGVLQRVARALLPPDDPPGR
eukprot:tig00000178_g12772.t1